VLFIVSATTAFLYTSSLIGFVAVIALLASLGFSAAMYPGCYVIGFEDEDAVGKATTAAFIILTIFVVSRIFGTELPQLEIFETGALFHAARYVAKHIGCKC